MRLKESDKGCLNGVMRWDVPSGVSAKAGRFLAGCGCTIRLKPIIDRYCIQVEYILYLLLPSSPTPGTTAACPSFAPTSLSSRGARTTRAGHDYPGAAVSPSVLFERCVIIVLPSVLIPRSDSATDHVG